MVFAVPSTSGTNKLCPDADAGYGRRRFMRWTSTVSDEPVLDRAVRAAAAALRAQLGDAPPDLVIVFASAHHAAEFDRIPALIAAAFDPALLVGCSAGGVIGGGHEVEQR